MIKSLNKNDKFSTPFVTKKSWRIQNIENEDLILWQSGSYTGSLAAMFLDYGDGTYSSSVLNVDCALALQQQSQPTLIYQVGNNISGTFYPSGSDYYNKNKNDINLDGTYKNIIYDVHKQLFYNNFNNPTQLFGIENLNLSDTSRVLTDEMEVFTIPTKYFGEKMLPNSIYIVDKKLDDTFIIVDDGNCNLFLTGSHFSKYQEIYFEHLDCVGYISASFGCNECESPKELKIL